MTPIEKCIWKARSLVGVPWRHRGRNEKFGIDCIGLLVICAAFAGNPMRDRRDYSRTPWKDGLRREMIAHFGEPLDKSEMRPGDFVTMRLEGQPEAGHVGIVVDGPGESLHLIHSYSIVAITEHLIDRHWMDTIIEVYRPWQ